jgi:hypothetical protein
MVFCIYYAAQIGKPVEASACGKRNIGKCKKVGIETQF